MARASQDPSSAALLGGSPREFARFYARHEDAVLGFFLRRTESAELAADLTAETFARALEGRDRFDPGAGDAGAWLFGIARNLLASSLKRGRVEDETRRRLRMEPLSLDDAALARIDDLGAGVALAALGELPEDQRLAVAGRVLDGLDYGDLSHALQCSESVVRQRVSRGLRALRQRLEIER